MDASLRLLAALHERWMILLESLSEQQFGRAFSHPAARPHDHRQGDPALRLARPAPRGAHHEPARPAGVVSRSSPPRRTPSSALAQTVRCREDVGRKGEVLHLAPVDPGGIQPESDPAFRSDVRRHEVASRVLFDEAALLTSGRLADKRDPSVSVIVVEVVREDPVLHLEGKVVDTRALRRCLRQAVAQRNQPLPAVAVARPVRNQPRRRGVTSLWAMLATLTRHVVSNVARRPQTASAKSRPTIPRSAPCGTHPASWGSAQCSRWPKKLM